jgi:hypothetical protein
VHLVDVVNWFMECDSIVPAQTNSAGAIHQHRPNPELVPDTFSITWRMTSSSRRSPMPCHQPKTPVGYFGNQYGNYFFGEKCMMLVKRYGYWLKPNPPHRPVQMGPNRPTPAPNAPVSPLPFAARSFLDPAGPNELRDTTYGSATVHRTRNFLDCVKSRQKPVLRYRNWFQLDAVLPPRARCDSQGQICGVGWTFDESRVI